jgi:hypothetical protein
MLPNGVTLRQEKLMTRRPIYEILFDDSDVAFSPDCACPSRSLPPAPVLCTADPILPIILLPVIGFHAGNLTETVACLHSYLLHRLLDQAKYPQNIRSSSCINPSEKRAGSLYWAIEEFAIKLQALPKEASNERNPSQPTS